MPSRRPATRYRRWLAVGLGALLLGLAFDACWIEPRRLVVRHETLALPGWRESLHGLRVAIVSDLHGGGLHITTAQLGRVVNAINDAKPDLILLLGDFVRTSHSLPRMEPEAVAEALRPLHAPRGVFAVLGNHDWWLDGSQVARALESVGIRVLENEAAALDDGLWLVGISDAMTGDPDPQRALAPVPIGATVLAMTHNPDVFPLLPARISLTLAGHTHGGQVNVEILGENLNVARFYTPYVYGLYRSGRAAIYVTRGIGTIGMPARLGAPPEIAALRLRKA